MGILDELLGGGQRQQDYKDFINRYEQGDPSQGYTDQEVLKRYGEVSHAVQPDQYAQAAQEALSKLSPEERAAFVKMLQERAAARGVKLPGPVAPDPKDLGQVLTDLHKKPGQLRDMLGAPAQQLLHTRRFALDVSLAQPCTSARLCETFCYCTGAGGNRGYICRVA